jgi:hypothetical protein
MSYWIAEPEFESKTPGSRVLVWNHQESSMHEWREVQYHLLDHHYVATVFEKCASTITSDLWLWISPVYIILWMGKLRHREEEVLAPAQPSMCPMRGDPRPLRDTASVPRSILYPSRCSFVNLPLPTSRVLQRTQHRNLTQLFTPSSLPVGGNSWW